MENYVTNPDIQDAAPPVSEPKTWEETVVISDPLAQRGAGISAVGKPLQSSNFVEGTTGWRINSNGDAEFSNAVIRGDLSNTGQLVGDGSDGDVSITSGTTTLTKDMYYNDLTVSGTGVLATAGYRVYVKGTLTVDATSGAKIHHNGNAGSNASAATGGVAVSAAAGVTVVPGIGGVAGADGKSSGPSVGNNGTAGTASALSVGSVGVAGGAGGSSGTGQAGGSAGGAGAQTLTTKIGSFADVALSMYRNGTVTVFTNSSGSGSGGSGGCQSGGGGSTPSGGGGGSGATGGMILIIARAVSLTGSGCIQAKGGNGGNGGNATGGNDNGGGGGGGGGAGGVIIFAYGSLSGTGTLLVTGGTGGTGGGGTVNGDDGVTGATGTTGVVYLLRI